MQKVLCNIFFDAEAHLGEYLKDYTIKEVVDLITEQ